MRIATFRDAAGTRLGVVQADGLLVDLPRAAATLGATGVDEERPAVLRDMLALVAAGQSALDYVRAVVTGAPQDALLPLDGVELLAPIPRPTKNLFCLGRNYAEHAAESLRASGQEVKLPPYPNIFTKAVTTVTGPFADIPLDLSVSQQYDWEIELGVIIGQAGRHVAQADALAHVWGYTVINDLTARDLQHQGNIQWFQGKSIDKTCPIGPWIVTADELPDPQRLHLRLSVNGEVKQQDTTDHMLFDVATCIATLTRVLTLEPGDILATGTPAGVGFARTPPEFLHPGDVMETTIDEIGTMRNLMVDAR